MPKKLFGFLVLVIIFFIVVSVIVFARSLSGRVWGWRISLNLSGFKLASFTKDKISTSKVEKLEAVSGTTQIKLHRINIDDHKKYIADKQFVLMSLFLPTTSPYPEVITNIIDCPDEFKPKVKMVYNGTIYSLSAGERFNYGICSRDLIKYYSEYGIFDCKEKGIFEIRIFSSYREKIKAIMGSFRC